MNIFKFKHPSFLLTTVTIGNSHNAMPINYSEGKKGLIVLGIYAGLVIIFTTLRYSIYKFNNNNNVNLQEFNSWFTLEGED